MGRKAGKYKKKENNPPKKRTIHDEDDDMMNDEIDAFHKQRDIIPLDANEDAEESDEDNEYPVFELEDNIEDEEEEEDDDDDDIGDDTQLTGLAAKIARQQKYIQAKMGGVEDEMHDGAEDEEEKRTVWGRNKNLYYNAENVDYELQSSDEENPAEEEAEVLRLQKEKAQSLTAADFGLEDVSEDESDGEATFEELVQSKRGVSKTSAIKEDKDDSGTAYEEVKKDLNALTKEEQMDVVYSSAPELVGLLSELNDAFEQLENKVSPLLSKIREGENAKKEGMHYMEVKHLLLLSYCQAISFYLLLKSEGQPVRDHPVISRLVEIKNLLDKMKELDGNLPPDLEDILNKDKSDDRWGMVVEKHNAIKATSLSEAQQLSLISVKNTDIPKAPEASGLVEDDSLKAYKDNKSKLKHQDEKVGVQSMQMLKVRAALEEKLKQKGVFSSITKKHNEAKKRLLPVNGQLETLDDFDDDAREDGGLLRPSKLFKLVTPQANKAKVTAGDDDLPKRDDIGERRRKHELRVLAGAGIKSVDGVEDEAAALSRDGVAETNLDGESDADLEFYKQVEQEHAAKLTAKGEMYSRPTKLPSMSETLVDGKRQISYQMEKNRGLTRNRNKLTKNPRKKYRTKHQKAVERRKGQVREIKKPTGPYGGEVSGINAGISRSIRFKN